MARRDENGYLFFMDRAKDTIKSSGEKTPDDILAHRKPWLVGFKMPKRVEIVDALPKNPNGKIMKQLLRKQFSEGE